MKTLSTPWRAEQTKYGNWSVKNSKGETLIMIENRVSSIDAENLARAMAAFPEMYCALKRAQKLDAQLVPADRFSGARRKKKYEQLEEMEAGIVYALEKVEGKDTAAQQTQGNDGKAD